MDYVTRAEWGGAPPRSRALLSNGHIEGIAVHWSGAPEASDHANCRNVVWAIQNFHMRPTSQGGRGWADIAYSWLACRHGSIFEGRGWGVRTAANGSAAANDAYHAVCYLGNDSVPFTELGRQAVARVILEGRRLYPHALRVEPHSRFTNTSCPGDTIRSWIWASGWDIPEVDVVSDWVADWLEWRQTDGRKETRPEAAPAKIPDEVMELSNRMTKIRQVLGPTLLYQRWRDYRLIGADRPSTPDYLLPIPQRWWAAAENDHRFANTYFDQNKPAYAEDELREEIARLEALASQLRAEQDRAAEENRELEARVADARSALGC